MYTPRGVRKTSSSRPGRRALCGRNVLRVSLLAGLLCCLYVYLLVSSTAVTHGNNTKKHFVPLVEPQSQMPNYAAEPIETKPGNLRKVAKEEASDKPAQAVVMQTDEPSHRRSEVVLQTDEPSHRRSGIVPSLNGRCENYFQHGFTKIEIGCTPAVACYRNDRISATVCDMSNIMVDNTHIKVTHGGEPIADVFGRDDKLEYCTFEKGAFQARCTVQGDVGPQIGRRTSEILSSFSDVKDELECNHWVEEPTLFVTRFEYANLYHTMTDWYNAFQVLYLFNLSHAGVVILDGHSAGALDDGWAKMFRAFPPTYVSQLKPKTCFRQAYSVPFGYDSPLSIVWMKGSHGCGASPFVKEFAQFVSSSLGSAAIELHPRDSPVILLVYREDYVPHPQIGNRGVLRKTANAAELTNAVQLAFPGAQVLAVHFESMTLSEQIASVRAANVVVGVHGAGLGHVLFMQPGSSLIEIYPRGFSGRTHYVYFTQFVDVKHVKLLTSEPEKALNVNPRSIIPLIDKALQ